MEHAEQSYAILLRVQFIALEALLAATARANPSQKCGSK